MVMNHKSSIRVNVNRLIVLGLLSIAFNGAADTDIPNAKTIEKENAEILGIDKNKNEVRDEVETYIKKYLKKTDPNEYRAYFNYAQTLSLQLKNRYNTTELNKLDHQLHADRNCIYGIDSKEGGKNILELRGKVLESFHRYKAWEISASMKNINALPYIEKKERLKKCR